ncbi:tetratricopeptide repeat protein, partial [bacterium]
LILANPTGDLKSAYLEGVNIRNQFDTKRSQISIYFKSTDADSLYIKKNLRDYDIVHFAGHCEYDSKDPHGTGWVLSDRIFSTKDILIMGEDYSLPSLVFSNACQSAKSSADTISLDYQTKTYSLASAFLFSGVRHYIGTSRKIEDQVSFIFAKEFYSQLIRHKAVGECVRLSRLRLIKEYGINSIFWASYLLYGDPNFILLKPKPKASLLPLKKEKFFSSKPLKAFLLILIALSIAASLFFYFPLRYPKEYFDFLNSAELFNKGENIKVMHNCEAIIKKDPLFLDAYILLADTHSRMGQSGLAIKDYFDLALYSQKKHDTAKLSSAYTGIGWIYQQEGKYSKAIEFYNKALAIAKESGNRLNEAIVLRKMAVWNIDKGNNDAALVLLTKSSEINRQSQHKNEHKYQLACDYFDIGLVLENKDEFSSSRDFYLKSKALFEEIKAVNELSDYYFNLGEVYLFEKNYQKALESYMVGLKIDQLKDNRPSLAADYNMVGELYMEMGNLAEAENYFNKTIMLASQIK